MNAAKLEIVWKQTEGTDVFTMPLSREPMAKQSDARPVYSRCIAKGQSSARCPNCDSIIYSRRSGRCGVCAEALPSRLLFTPDESQRIERLLHAERIRHRVWMQDGRE